MGHRGAEFRVESSRELLSAVQEATTIMAAGSTAIFEGITFDHLEQSRSAIKQLDEKLQQQAQGNFASFEAYVAQLKPALAHPARAAELAHVENDEEEREQALRQALADYTAAVEVDIDQTVVQYVQAMNSMVSGMVEVLELALIEPELYVPDMPGSYSAASCGPLSH
jgi:hypothetical protein